ncbi:MAG: sugar phosphate isomerase/epimerase family protein [Pseudomonadota bacterium]
MKLALCNEVLRDHPFEEQCAHAATLGFDGLELAPFTLAQDPATLTAEDAVRVRRAMEAEGLVCCSLHWLLAAPEGLSITTDDPGIRVRTIALMERLVGFAAEVGAGVLVHGSPQQRVLPVDDEAASRARGLAYFAAAGEAAAKAGVRYLIEPLARTETAFINTVTEAEAIVREVGSKGLATMIDTCATANIGVDVVATIDAHLPGGQVAHIHVNDPNRRGPGEGALDFAPIIGALRRQDYAGWISAEPFIYKPTGLACAARAAGVLCALTGKTL